VLLREHQQRHAADVYFGRDKAILREREKIKKRTIQQRRLQHQKQAP
jgi:putative transposase